MLLRPSSGEAGLRFWRNAGRTFHQFHAVFFRLSRASGCPEQGAGAKEKEAWEGDWDDEKTPNERYESDAADPYVDPDRCQDANGGSSTPRSGAQERDTSRTPPPR